MSINIARYNNKPAGIYREIIDRSQRPDFPFNQSRLVVGFSRKGPFNRPILINNVEESRTLFGRPDRYLEKRGSFFQRTIEQALEAGPVYALNLRKLNPSNIVDFVEAIDVSANVTVEATPLTTEVDPGSITFQGEQIMFDGQPVIFGGQTDPEIKNVIEAELKRLYTTDKFWFLDPESLASEVASSNDSLIRFANTGQSTFTVFMTKSDMDGFDVPASEWYTNPSDKPEWMSEEAWISDFNVKIVVVKGDYGLERLPKLASDPIYGSYFDWDEDEPTKSGLKYGMMNEFLSLSSVEVIQEFEGSLIPGMTNQDGDDVYVGGRINQFASATGFLFHIDEDKFDNIASAPINLLGAPTGVNYPVTTLSYQVKEEQDVASTLSLYTGDIGGEPVTNTSTEFFIEYDNLPSEWTDSTSYTIGDIVENNGTFYIVTDDHTSASADEPGVGNDWEDYWEVYTGTLDATQKIRRGDLVVSQDGESLVRVIEANRAEEGEYITRVRTDSSVNISGDEVTKFTPINRAASHLVGYALKGFTMTANHMPTGNWTSIKERVLSVISDTNIGDAIVDRENSDFRYLVDSFGMGIDNASKSEFTRLCERKQNMFGIINAPSFEDFRNSTNPVFVDQFGNLNTDLIKEGGREGTGTFRFTLPGRSQGGFFGAYYGNYLRVREGNQEFLVPPAGMVSNLYVRKWTQAQPWTIIAGNEWTIAGSGVVGVEYTMDDNDRLNFEKVGINPIIEKRGVGITIEGNLTAQQTPKSSLSSINGTEVVIYLQDQIAAILSQYQWKFNTEQTRLEIKNLADAVCQRVQTGDGIFDFENVMDRSNNTDEVIDNEIGVLNTYIEVAKGMRVLVNPLTIFRTGAIAQGAVEELTN